MDSSIKQYADSLYEKTLTESATTLRRESTDYLLERSKTQDHRQLFSGIDFQAQVRFYANHIERSTAARLDSYQRAYSEIDRLPTEGELREILDDFKATWEIQIKHSTQALSNFLAARNVPAGLDVSEGLRATSAHGHDRVLQEWKIWRDRTQLQRSIPETRPVTDVPESTVVAPPDTQRTTQIRNIWKHPANFWHWSSRWDWFTVLCIGGLAFVAVNEAAIGLFLIFLSLLSLTSKFWHGNSQMLTKISGTVGTAVIMGLCTMATFAYMEEKPWSNVPVFLDRFIILKTIPDSAAIKSPSYPPQFDFPSTTFPVPVKKETLPIPQRPYDPTGLRREKFLELLRKAQSEPRDLIRIGCIAWSDAACVAAGRFLLLFSEAGWTIDSNRVFRLEPSVPIDGMAMVAHIDNVGDAQKLPPHLGTWQKMDGSQVTIWWAFKQMGIPVSASSDQAMPRGTLGIYFGPEPQSQ